MDTIIEAPGAFWFLAPTGALEEGIFWVCPSVCQCVRHFPQKNTVEFLKHSKESRRDLGQAGKQAGTKAGKQAGK